MSSQMWAGSVAPSYRIMETRSSATTLCERCAPAAVLCLLLSLFAAPARAADSWSSAASLATARENHIATLLPSGGFGGSGWLASAELYDSGETLSPAVVPALSWSGLIVLVPCLGIMGSVLRRASA